MASQAHRVQELEQVIADLVQQDSIIDKWSVLQTYVLVAAELERVSQAAYEMQLDNAQLAQTCHQLQTAQAQQEAQLHRYRQTEYCIRQEHEKNVQQIKELVQQNDQLCESISNIQNKASTNHPLQDDKINLLLAVNKKLEMENQGYESRFGELTHRCRDVEKENKYLTAKLKDQKAEIDQVLTDMKDCEEIYRNTIDQSKERVAQLDQQIAELRAQNEWNEQKIEQLLRYNEELERVDRQEIEEQTQTVQQMQTKLEHEKQLNADLAKQKKLQDLRNEEYRKEIDSLKSQLNSQAQDLRKSAESIHVLEKQHQQMNAQYKETILRTETDLQGKAQESIYLSKQVEQLKKQLQSEQAIASQEQQRLERERVKLQQAAKSWQARVDELEPALVAATQERDQLSLRCRLAKQKDDDNEHLLGQVSTLRNDNAKLKQVIIDLTDSINQQKNMFHSCQLEMVGYRDQISTLQESKVKHDRVVGDLHTELEREDATIVGLRHELQSLHEEVAQVTKWNQQLHDQVDDFRQRNQHLNSLLYERENRAPDYYGPRKSPYNANKKYY